jgi:DNA-binding NtrC family response regulator
MATILLIDDETDLTDFVRRELELHGHSLECLDRAEKGPDRLADKRFDVVLLDNKLPGMTGIEFLEAVRARGIETPVILMTGAHSSSTAIRSKKLGAVEYVIKPGDYQSLVASLLPMIQRVMESGQQPKVPPPQRPLPRAPGEPELVGSSKPMREVYDRIGLFAESGDTVLILGETGTGKELVARAIHNESPRADGPFVALNCGALNENLLESELFGHEKAAYTGADKKRIGRFEMAHMGTLFLDEIGDVPMSMQIKLLRVLQERKFERAGGSELVKVDVRVLAATHRDLPRMVREGEFRRDLFFRLDGVTIRLPPLRERMDDIPELVEGLLTRAAEDANRPRPEVAPETLQRLRAHPHRWPGNVRELENVIHRALRLCRGPVVLPSHVDFQTDDLTNTQTSTVDSEALAGLNKAIAWAFDTNQEKIWPLLRDLLERELLRVSLERLNGDKTRIAELLDMAWNTVNKRVQAYGLKAAKPAHEEDAK